MKADRVAKLYGDLTNKERAALYFRYICDRNELEMDRVESSVPWKNYCCIDFQYSDWRDSFFHMALVWALDCWRLRTRQWAAFALIHLLMQSGERDQAHEVMAEHKRLEARLLAMDRALEVTCAEHGLEAEAVRRLTGTPTFDPLFPELDPDSGYQAEVQLNLSRCLPVR
ncbi:MAG: hypothetical protein HYT77_02300 [Deltaproteobacteria bacterium]|nr:hypothetical protein [Deltaproteobacteria bacterium]